MTIINKIAAETPVRDTKELEYLKEILVMNYKMGIYDIGIEPPSTEFEHISKEVFISSIERIISLVDFTIKNGIDLEQQKVSDKINEYIKEIESAKETAIDKSKLN